MKRNQNQDPHRYDDMLDLPHYQDPGRPRMSMHDRAAQFSPFAALTGHDAAVKETARLTDRKIEISESRMEVLNRRLRYLKEHLSERKEVTAEFFQPDRVKEGGRYLTKTGIVRKVDPYRKTLVWTDNCEIRIQNISDLYGELFEHMTEEI